MQGSKGGSIYSTSSSIGIAGETPNSTEILTESVNVQETDFKRMEILSGLGDEPRSKRRLSELQNLVDKLREDFANELGERDTVILLYKNLWRESEAELASVKCEMKHLKAELEALKQRQFDKDAHDSSVGGCETSEHRGTVNCSLELSSSPKGNMDQTAIRISHGKEAKGPDTRPNLNSLMNVTPQPHAKETFLKRSAILFSRDISLREGDTLDNWNRTNCKNTLDSIMNLKEDMMDESAILSSQGRNSEELDSKTNLNSPVNVAPRVPAKGTVLERAAILFSRNKSLGEGETSENRGNKNSLEFNLNPKENIKDKVAMLLSLGKDYKDIDTKTNSKPLVSIKPEAHAKGSFWGQEATVSQDKSLVDLVDGDISENWGRANCKTSLEINLNPKQNIVGEGYMPVPQGKGHNDLHTKTNLSSPMNITPQTRAEGTFLERAAILFSRDISPREGETSENKGGANFKNPLGVNLNPLEETQGISKSTCDTEEFSSSCLRPKTPSAFCMEQFLDLLSGSDSSSEEDELIGTLGSNGQLKSSSSVLSDDLICSQSQRFYRGVQLEEPKFDIDLTKLIDASTSENTMDKDSMQLSLGKDHENLDTKANLNSPVSVTPEAHAKQTFWEQEATFSQDKSLVDAELSEIWGRANCKASLEINLNSKENVMGDGMMLLSQGNNYKDLDKMTNLSSPRNVAPQANVGGTFLERAVTLFLRDRSIGECMTSEYRGKGNCNDPQGVKLTPKENMADDGAMLPSQEKDHDGVYTKANLNSAVNVTPQAHPRETFLERAAILFSRYENLGEGEISGSWGRANCETSLENNLNPKQNIMGEGAMLLSQGKDHMDFDQKTNLSSPVNVTPQTHSEGPVLERAAILFSRNRSLGEGETAENKGGANCKIPPGVNLNPLEENRDIIESTYDTEEFSNSYLRPKTPSAFRMEQFLDLPETDYSSEKYELIETLGLKGQLESSSSVLRDDLVCSQSQCFYDGVQLEESNIDSDLTKRIDASTSETSGKKRKYDDVIIMEESRQILLANSSTIKKLDPEGGNVVIRINSESCHDPPECGADVEYLNEKDIGFITHCQHDSDCIIVASEGEISSAKSDSSWEHLEVEENISLL